MSQSLLNKVWSFLVVVLLYLALNVWSITQQWQLSLPGNPFKDGKTTPFGVALYGVVLCCPLLVLISVVTRIYSARSLAQRWQDRFPRFGDFELDTSKDYARAFQAISLSIFLLVPLAGIAHFQNKMLNGSVFLKKEPCPAAPTECLSKETSLEGWRGMLFHKPIDVNTAGRLVYDPDLKNDIAPTFIPFVEPWGCLILVSISMFSGIWCLQGVFRPASPTLARHSGAKHTKHGDHSMPSSGRSGHTP
jgi:hypothetical protein